MPDVFDAALRTAFADPNMSVPVVFCAAPGRAEQALRAMFREPLDDVRGFGQGQVLAGAYTVDVLVADVPDKPTRKSRVLVGGTLYGVSDATRSNRGRVWRLGLENA